MPDTLNEIAPFVSGSPVDRLALKIRREQQNAKIEQHGLFGAERPSRYGHDTKTSPRGTQVAKRGIPETSTAPSLAENLFMNATVFKNATKTGEVNPSVSPSGEDWISINDLPANVQKVLFAATPSGYGVAGFRLSALKDTKQRELLNQWVSMGQREKQARLQAAEQTDPKFRAQLQAAQASMVPEE